MSDIIIRLANHGDRSQLFDVWQRSVKDSHGFVSEEDLVAMVPQVQDYFRTADTDFFVACTDDGAIIALMGLSGCDLESLFVLPEFCRQGVGTRLIKHAQMLHPALTVEVNEQNQNAISFYRACGFAVVGRSELDHQQRPYPLLQMSWSQ